MYSIASPCSFTVLFCFTLFWAAIKRMMSLLWGFPTSPRKPQTMTWGMCVHATLIICIVLVSQFSRANLSLRYICVFSCARSYSTSSGRFSAFILPQQRLTARFALYHPYDMISRKLYLVTRLLQARDKSVHAIAYVIQLISSWPPFYMKRHLRVMLASRTYPALCSWPFILDKKSVCVRARIF